MRQIAEKTHLYLGEKSTGLSLSKWNNLTLTLLSGTVGLAGFKSTIMLYYFRGLIMGLFVVEPARRGIHTKMSSSDGL